MEFNYHWRFLCGTTGGKGLKMPSSTLELWREVVLSFNQPLSYSNYSGSYPPPFDSGITMEFNYHWRFLCGTTGGKGLKMPSSTLELWREVVLSFNQPLSYSNYSGSYPTPFVSGIAMELNYYWRFLCGTPGGKGLKMPSSTFELWREVVLSFNHSCLRFIAWIQLSLI